MEAVRALLIKANSEAESHYKNLSSDKVDGAKRADRQIINNQWLVQQQVARKAVLDEVASVVEELRRKDGYSVVLDKTAVLAIGERDDITEQVINLLKNSTVDFGALPEVSIKKDGADNEKH